MDIYSFILSVSALDTGTAFSYRIAIPKGQIGLFYILLPYINTLILDIILKLLLHIPYSLLFVGRLSVVAFIIGLYGSFGSFFFSSVIFIISFRRIFCYLHFITICSTVQYAVAQNVRYNELTYSFK